MGSKSPSTVTNVSTPPPQVLQEYSQVTNRANQVANTPYTPYGGQLVAPVNAQQNTGIGGVNNYANAAQPYLTGAAGLTLAGAGPANAQQFSGQALNQYLSPYTQDVVNATQAAFANQNTQQAQQLEGNAIGAGAFGGDRAGVAQGILAGQQQTAEAPVIAGLENQNYTQALGEFNTQQQTNLSAEQANLARLQAAGLQLGNIGTAAQTAGLQGAGAQLQAGTLQQQTQQAQDAAAYNQFLQAQAYPFQTTAFQANIAEGIGSNSGGTSTSTASAPNPAASYIGAGLGLLGAFAARGGRIHPHYAKGGLVIDARDRFAGGGVGGQVIPYASNEGNVQSWVPQVVGLSLGPGMHIPNAQQPANSNQQQQQGMQNLQTGLTSFGKGLSNSSIGDNISDFMQDNFARGGLVLRPRFDDGGAAYGSLAGPPAVDPMGQMAAQYANTMFPTAGNAALRPTANPPPAAAQPPPNPIEALKSGIAGVETPGSKNPYGEIGPVTDSGDRAYGKYQVMGANIPGWTREVLGTAMTPAQFLSDRDAQEKIASAKLGQYLSSTGNPQDAASMWFTGRPLAQGASARDMNGMSGAEYAARATGAFPSAFAGRGAGLQTSAFQGVSPGTGLGGATMAEPAVIPGIGSEAELAASGSPNVPPPSPSKGGLFGLNLSDPVRLGLISAGLGIMASPSRNLGMAIGQGGQQGIQTYEQALNQVREQNLTKAQIANYQSEIATRPQDIALRAKALELQTSLIQRQLAAGSAMAGAASPPPSVGGPSPALGSVGAGAPAIPNPNAAGVPAPAKGPAASALANPNDAFWKEGVPDLENPITLNERARAVAPYNPELAGQLMAKAQAIVTRGTVMKNGQLVPIPGFPESQAAIEGAKTAAQKAAENAALPNIDPATGAKFIPPPGAPVPVTTPAATSFAPSKPFSIDPETAKVTTNIPPAPNGGGYIVPNLPAGAKLTDLPPVTQEQIKADNEFLKEEVATSRATDTVISRTQAIAQAFKTFQSGSLTDHQHDAAALAVALGQPGIGQAIMNGSVSGPEWVDKEGVNSVLDTLKAATPRFAQAEFRAVAEKGTPSTTKQPQTNNQMVAEMLAVGNRNKAFLNDWEQAKQQGWTSPTAFYTAWQTANPLDGFIKSSQRQIGNFAGMDLPPASDWTAGAVYAAPKTLDAPKTQLLAKYGVKPGDLFRFNGHGATGREIQPIAKSEYFSAQLGAQ